MNLKQPYEILIADKLQGLPVPDRADAIWARIEPELDVAANSDANEPAEPAHPTLTGTAAKTIAMVGGGLIALVVLFLIIKKNAKRTKDKRLQPSIEQTDTQKATQQSPATAADTVLYIQPMPSPKTIKTSTGSSTPGNEPIIRNNTASPLPLTLPQKDSAASLDISARIQGPVDSSLLQTIPKKPRGIQIPDNGYKIQCNRLDSGKNGRQ